MERRESFSCQWQRRRTFHHLLFCQTPNFINVLSKMLFSQNKANNVLSKFIKILSNSDGYLDSLLFCQSLQSCLTEQFSCLTEILSRAWFVWQNIPKMFKNHKSLLISGMNQYFEKSPWQKLQNHISQLLSGEFFDWSLSLGDQFKKLFLHFAKASFYLKMVTARGLCTKAIHF